MTLEKSAFHPIKSATDGVFNTANGKLIDLLEPAEEAIDIEDIANALSLICRFGGHTSRFYSVAQHSLLVAALAPDSLKKEALLHDAAEAYLGDVIKPLKLLIGEAYTTIEDIFENVIFQKFGVDQNKLNAIKEFDLQALEFEHEALQCGDATRLVAALQRHDLIVGGTETFYRPLIARMKFLEEFNKLFPNQAISKEQLWPERTV